MKARDKKVRAAISAAVTAYIKGEAEMAAVSGLVAANRGRSPLEQGPFTRENRWGQTGRQFGMQLRTMMQLRTLK
ncbi:MAG: hypothetical protein B5M56_03610 [Desulfococcus sp. 4484_241]|nr:MAG: hypothetical protein B5M56_03610 [Desulfococcus sp. 4484_241]RLC33698.1 MAG: hypothetical protein DRH32_00525 [Deltaproteobacteria bacterium]